MTLAMERAIIRSLIRKIKQTDFTRRFHVRQTGTIANGPFARAFHRRDRSRIRTPGLVPRNEKPEEKPIEPLTESHHPSIHPRPRGRIIGRVSSPDMRRDQRLMASRHHGGLQGVSRSVDMHSIDKAHVRNLFG